MASWIDEYLREMAIRRERAGWTMYGSDYQESKQTAEERTRGFVEEMMREKGATWVTTALRDQMVMSHAPKIEDDDKFDGGPAWRTTPTTVIEETDYERETIQFARKAMIEKGPLWVRVALHEAYARDSKQEQGLKDLQDLQAGVGIGGPVWKQEKNAGKTVEEVVEESARTTAHMQTHRVMGLWASTEGKVHIKLANGTEVVVPLEVGEQFELLQEAQVTVRTLP